ncbi:hypothetical protein ABIC51_005699 [Burkholderia sp. 572]
MPAQCIKEVAIVEVTKQFVQGVRHISPAKISS